MEGRTLRLMMIVPMLFLAASVFVEIGNCHSAQLTIRAELNDTIALLAKCEDDAVAKQDTIRRLERINYAMAQPLMMVADQKMPGTLLVLSVMSALSIAYYRRNMAKLNVVQVNSCEDNRRQGPPLQEIRLTPMQRQLVDMLLNAPGNCVAKHDICTALWGNKDNAEESLYTLVRRTKKTLAEANAAIVSNRGESYQLLLNA